MIAQVTSTSWWFLALIFGAGFALLLIASVDAILKQLQRIADSLARTEALSEAAVEDAFGVREDRIDLRLVYCKHCNKSHAVREGDRECSDGAWISL